MKRFFCIVVLSFLAITFCNGQSTYYNDAIYQQLGTKRTHVKTLGYHTVDSLFRLPKDTLSLAPDGSMAWVNGLIYQKDSYWKLAGGEVTQSALDDTAAAIRGDVIDSIGRRAGVDSFDVYKNGAYVYSVKDSTGGDGTLKVQRGGSGIPMWWNNEIDTALVIKDVTDGYGLNVQTKTDSTLEYSVDTTLISTKDYVDNAVAAGGGGMDSLEVVEYDSLAVNNVWINSSLRRMGYRLDSFYYHIAITDSVRYIEPLELDVDAQDYITRVEAAGRTLTPTEEGYINTYFLALKADGIWDKIYDRALLIWGDAEANAETFKDVANTTWIGTVTHASDGAASDGIAGYGDLGFNHTVLTLNSTHLSLYSQQDLSQLSTYDIGSRGSVSSTMSMMLESAGSAIFEMNTTTADVGKITRANGVSTGYFCATRISSTDLRAIINGVQIGAVVTGANTGTLASYNFFLFRSNIAGTPSTAVSARKISMWSVGDGLTTTECADDNTATEVFHDSMGIGKQ